MKWWINLFLLFSFLFFTGQFAYAHEEKEIEGFAKDCKFLYLLREDSIDKHSLPSLQLTASVDLPSRTKGKSIKIAGQCGDPTETILVSVKRKGRGGGEAILSYSEDLQLIGQLSIEEEDDDDDDNDDDDDDDDDDNDD